MTFVQFHLAFLVEIVDIAFWWKWNLPALCSRESLLTDFVMKYLQSLLFSVQEHPLELRFGVTISPKNGVKVKIVKRDE